MLKNDLKAPFSIATTQRSWGGYYSFPSIAPLTLDLYLIILCVKQRGIKYHFLNLWYDSTWDWTPVSQAIGEHSNHYVYLYNFFIYVWIYIYIYIYIYISYLYLGIFDIYIYIYFFFLNVFIHVSTYIYIYIYIYVKA